MIRKQRGRRILSILLVMCMLLQTNLIAEADRIDDLKKKNQQDQENLDNINDEIEGLKDEQQGIKSEMAELHAEIVDMMTSISILEDEIALKKEEIQQAQQDLTQAIETEKNQYESMKVRIRFMYERGEMNYLDALISAASISDVLNKADYIEKLYDYDRDMLNAYQESREEVEELKAMLEEEESELEDAQQECREEQLAMEKAFKELESISADYALQISKAKQQAEVYKAQIKKQNAEIKKLEEEKRKAALAATQKKVQGTATVNKQEIMSVKGSDKGKQIAIYACGFVGNPYVWGGTDLLKGADCSGFTQSVYKAYGYKIPRTSFQQRSAGREVSYADAEPGDLICYAGHVAMYIGNGKIVHAKSSKTGIRIDYAGYKQIICVRRIV